METYRCFHLKRHIVKAVSIQYSKDSKFLYVGVNINYVTNV